MGKAEVEEQERELTGRGQEREGETKDVAGMREGGKMRPSSNRTRFSLIVSGGRRASDKGGNPTVIGL
jgi:hypothetical protein